MSNEKSIQNLKPFKKGKDDRRASGKPKGALSAKVIIRKWLESHEKIKNPLTQETQTVTVLDSMTLALIAKARKGDVAAFNALLDRTEGKPTQPLANDAENPLLPDISKLSKEELRLLLSMKNKLSV